MGNFRHAQQLFDVVKKKTNGIYAALMKSEVMSEICSALMIFVCLGYIKQCMYNEAINKHLP